MKNTGLIIGRAYPIFDCFHGQPQAHVRPRVLTKHTHNLAIMFKAGLYPVISFNAARSAFSGKLDLRKSRALRFRTPGKEVCWCTSGCG
jgi:hypothetical protein